MKRITLIGLLLIFTPYILSAQTSSKTEDAIEKKFDFWVGEWNATWTKKDGTIGKGKNTITKTLNEKVIEENFEITDDGQNTGFTGRSWSVYNPNYKKWYQTWVDNQAGYIPLEGSFDGEKRIFQTHVRKLADNKTMTSRMVFYNIKPDSFDWDWEASSDEGKTWTLQWRIHYERVKQK